MSGIVKTVFNKVVKMMFERIGRQIHRRLCDHKGEKTIMTNSKSYLEDFWDHST